MDSWDTSWHHWRMTAMTELIDLASPPVSMEAVEAVTSALATPGDKNVNFALDVPRSCAKLILEVLTQERNQGALVIPAKHEFSPAEVATILGVSRQTVVRSIADGEIPARRVGTHWRIAASDITLALKEQKRKRHEAVVRLAKMTADW